MKKISVYKYEIISSFIASIIGVINHFTYKLSNFNVIVGIFTATNESVWEHLKLIFFPLLIATIIGFILFKKQYPSYLTIKTNSIIISLLFIIIFFYTYSGILGKTYVIIDISSFFYLLLLVKFILLIN